MPTHTANGDAIGPVRPPLLRALARPKVLASGAIAVLVAAGWIYLGLILGGQNSEGLLRLLCQPTYGMAGSNGAAAALLTFAMWCAMALAMMLPTAGPMIMTYADLAETAAAKGEAAASPLVLAGGYLVVWLGAALALATLQGLLARFGLLDDMMGAASPLFAGAVFLGAGAYQFSALKQACVTQCQHPFRFFFAHWTAEPHGVFRLGLQQGLYCLGCCWAMMLLMFAVGVMNIFWMAALGAIMTIEKINTTTRFSRALGAVFFAIGLAMIAHAVIGHWPARAASGQARIFIESQGAIGAG